MQNDAVSHYTDNRDAGEVNRYNEARIEALLRRIAEKDLEIQALQAQLIARDLALAELMKGKEA